MRKILLIIIYLSLPGILTGCTLLRAVSRPRSHAGNASLPSPFTPYSGPKAHINVSDFDVKAVKEAVETGTALREMLANALINTKRFGITEQKAASLIITAAVTEFEPQASRGNAGVGGGGGAGNGMLGGLLSPYLNKARMALDIRITDAATSEVLDVTRVESQASDAAVSFMSGFFGGWEMGNGLSVYANTPMEKAIRTCIIEAARYISEAVPKTYYKY